MNVLIACEESQEVCKAFRAKGHNAFSCDLLPCSGGYPDWHIQADAIKETEFGDWDLVIAFPPCTHLAVSGARWFKDKKKEQKEAIDFFLYFTSIQWEKWCIENPIGIMSSVYRKPDQIIQPWHFGHTETKSTCLWLKGLPPLVPSDIVGPPPKNMSLQDKAKWNKVHRMPPGPDRARLRSKTYSGIAEAMASQWSNVI